MDHTILISLFYFIIYNNLINELIKILDFDN